MGPLAKERADFFVVEAPDYFDGAGVCVFEAGGNQCFNSGERAEFIIDATREDEFFVEAAKLSRLGVKKLELPVDDGAIWADVSDEMKMKIAPTYSLEYSSLLLLPSPTALAV